MMTFFKVNMYIFFNAILFFFEHNQQYLNIVIDFTVDFPHYMYCNQLLHIHVMWQVALLKSAQYLNIA